MLPLLSQADASMSKAIQFRPDPSLASEQTLIEYSVMIKVALEDALRQSGRTKTQRCSRSSAKALERKSKPDLSSSLRWADSIPPADTSQKDLYVQLCLDALNDAVSSGLNDPSQLLNEKRLDPVRNAPRFQELVRDLNAKASPPAK